MKKRLILVTTVLAFSVAVLLAAQATQDLTDNPAIQDAEVNFGSLHPQPAVPANHVMLPDDVTILKGGTVTFIMNGGAHGVAIYPVSKNTTREDIAEDLCQGGPAVCSLGAGTGTAQYLVTDGNGDVVIDTGTNPPENRVNYLPGQLFAVGAGIFLTGSTPTTAGTQVRYRFADDGRFLVVCMNRSHYVNDWMFGFVNVR
jgi:plastocyanin